MCFEKMLWDISEMVNATAFKLVPLCSAPRKLTSKDFWNSMNNRKPLSQQKWVLRKCCGVSQKLWMLELWTCAIVFSTPENFLVKISGALGMTGSHFLSRNVFLENAEGYLRNGECYSFQTKAIVFSTPENLLVQISGALWTTESHFLS